MASLELFLYENFFGAFSPPFSYFWLLWKLVRESLLFSHFFLGTFLPSTFHFRSREYMWGRESFFLSFLVLVAFLFSCSLSMHGDRKSDVTLLNTFVPYLFVFSSPFRLLLSFSFFFWFPTYGSCKWVRERGIEACFRSLFGERNPFWFINFDIILSTFRSS